MDSRAKQRLTGAVILVALFVLFVPELLTGPRREPAPATPASEEGLRSVTIDIDAPAPATQAVTQEPDTPIVLPPVAANPMAAPQATPVEPMAVAPEPARVEATPVEPARVEPPAVRAAPVVAPAAARPQSGAFAVQLGSFGSKDNADRLVRDMTAKGFAAFIAPISSGGRELYRVRVGPARDRAAAEALAAQLRRVGQSGSIVPIS